MEYFGEKDEGVYRFRLSGQHKGHKIYRGSSGAPIVDYSGEIVSIVVGGCERDNEIYGVPINKYEHIIGSSI